jgi:hypothetical protein
MSGSECTTRRDLGRGLVATQSGLARVARSPRVPASVSCGGPGQRFPRSNPPRVTVRDREQLTRTEPERQPRGPHFGFTRPVHRLAGSHQGSQQPCRFSRPAAAWAAPMFCSRPRKLGCADDQHASPEESSQRQDRADDGLPSKHPDDSGAQPQPGGRHRRAACAGHPTGCPARRPRLRSRPTDCCSPTGCTDAL